MLKDLEELREGSSTKIEQLHASIASSDSLLHITTSQRFGMIVIDSGPSREMTKFHKKLRRRGTRITLPLCLESPDSRGEDSNEG